MVTKMGALDLFAKKKEKDDLTRQFDFQGNQANMEIMNNDSPMETMMYGDKDKPDLTKWQQDMDPWLKKIVLKLKRQVLIDGKLVPIYTGATQLCSDECIENTVNLLEGITSPTTILSNLSEEQIVNQEIQLERTLILDILITERTKYGTPLSNLSQVKKVFRSFAYPTFFRALKGFEAKNLREIRSVKELRNMGLEDNPNKKKGMFSM